MNVVYLVTARNADSLKDTAIAIREAQALAPASACIVMVDSFHVKKGNEILAEIGDFWTSKMVIPCQLPSNRSEGAKKSLLLMQFFNSGYTLFPGGWIVIDSPHKPRMENPLTVMKKLTDNRLQVAATLEKKEGNASIPVGPIAIDRKVHHLRLFFSGNTTGWRDRMGLYLKGLKYEGVHEDDFPFDKKVFSSAPLIPTEVQSSVSEMSDEDLIEACSAIRGRRMHPDTKRETLERIFISHKQEEAVTHGH